MGAVSIIAGQAPSNKEIQSIETAFGAAPHVNEIPAGLESSISLISPEGARDADALSRFAAQADANPDALIIMRAANTMDQFPGTARDGVFLTENVFRDIVPGLQISATGIRLPAELMHIAQSRSADQGIAELAVIAYLRAQSAGVEIEFVEGSFKREGSSLDNTAVARVLSVAVESFNIEDLFPNHPWVQHSQESGAACYHSLAARFIALKDYDMAIECLDQSDGLEESPRSYGLRAIISRERGDVLSAIADMILSLKAYESRKDGEHYLRFSPQDFAPMTDALKEGLAALHRQDNSAALARFSSAVLAFDDFYQQNGLLR